jgi:rhodanese-related sulfurtransferase
MCASPWNSRWRASRAINIPLGQLRSRLGELPRDRDILVICRSGGRAYYATRILLQDGFNARTLSGVMLSRTHAANFWES